MLHENHTWTHSFADVDVCRMPYACAENWRGKKWNYVVEHLPQTDAGHTHRQNRQVHFVFDDRKLHMHRYAHLSSEKDFPAHCTRPTPPFYHIAKRQKASHGMRLQQKKSGINLQRNCTCRRPHNHHSGCFSHYFPFSLLFQRPLSSTWKGTYFFTIKSKGGENGEDEEEKRILIGPTMLPQQQRCSKRWRSVGFPGRAHFEI